MTLHNQTKPGPREAYNPPAAGPVASRVPTHTHPIPAEWDRVLLRKDLLKKITTFVDSESIFNLGRTCRSLSDTVFGSYINNTQPEISYSDYGPYGGHLSAPIGHPKGLLTAVRCSLPPRASFTSIAYGFLPNRGFQGLIQDLSDLHTLIERQPRAMRYVSLYFSQIDHGLKAPSVHQKALLERGHPTPEGFRDKLCCVLDSAILKGARFLDVNGGFDTLQMLLDRNPTPQPGQSIEASKVHVGSKDHAEDVIQTIASSTTTHEAVDGPPSDGQRTSSSKRRSFFSSISMRLNSPRSQGSPSPRGSIAPKVVKEVAQQFSGSLTQRPSFSGLPFNPPPRVEELHIRTDMLLSPLFLPWTLDVLKNNARTLQDLKFECSETLSSTWHNVFKSATLPRLKKLHIIVAPLLVQKQLDIDPDDIIHFLSRCEAVEDVIFYGLRPGIPSPQAIQSLHVPQLASFAGHPSDVLWMLKLHKSLVPKLRRIVVTTEYYAGSLIKVPFDHTLINDVLEVLDADGRELVLGFDFRVEGGLEEWMLGRVHQARTRRLLQQIRSLDICFSWYMNFTLEKLQVVSNFINTFPNVEHVTFNQLQVSPNWENVGMGDVVATKAFFSKHLLKVKKVKINSEAEMTLDNDAARATAQPGPRERVPGPPIA
ncbi:hypothetical protein BKA70DRAFT_1562234 [Coprinopsis sp. MPI-PUGE-AT-0042]|nr:hypothetical protein BKA70DRAFT_1562234 [Coprinopsis sp. MPI-PUGE-AT-0042]